MALDVYFQQDIRRNIVAVAVAMLSAAAAHGVTNVEYCRGVLDTSRAQALNHGMPWAEILAELREALGDAVLSGHPVRHWPRDAGRGDLLGELVQRDVIGG